MKLLIVTQVVDSEDPVLGFFHRWIEVFAEQVVGVEVICLREGTHTLPSNVRVHSLGKEKGGNTLLYALRFLMLSLTLRYDRVFVHMNPEYFILAGWFWRLAGKKSALWYVHKSVPPVLRIGSWFADRIFSASKESFRMKSSKLEIVGHGIDVSGIPVPHEAQTLAPRVISVGRLSPTKNHHVVIEAFSILQKSFPSATLTVIGGAATPSDTAYEKQLRKEIRTSITFTGPLSHQEVLARYSDADLFLHASETGSVDKVVLEALAAGVRVVSASEAFRNRALPIRSASLSATSLAEAAETSLQAAFDGAAARRAIEEHYGLQGLVKRILSRI